MEYVLGSSQEPYVDETKIKGRRRFYYLWLAVDSNSRPCRELGLEWRHETFGSRNAMERPFFPIKHRLRGFYKRFPWNAKFETISNSLRAFIFLYYTLEGLS